MRRALVAAPILMLVLAVSGESAAKVPNRWSWPDGEVRAWTGEWTGRGFRFSFVLSLRRRGEEVDGSFVFTCDDGWPERRGHRVTEYVRGRWWQSTLTLDGTSVSDETMWIVDRYRIDVGPRGELGGSSRTVNRDWAGQLRGQALQPRRR